MSLEFYPRYPRFDFSSDFLCVTVVEVGLISAGLIGIELAVALKPAY